MHVPDAPPAPLATLLDRLRAEADTTIAEDASGAWYAGRGDNASYGPHASAEDALVALVALVWSRYDETRAERDFAQAEAHELRTALAEARRVALDTARVLEQLARQ